MADVSKLNLYGEELSIKDATGRSLANQANNTATNAITVATTAGKNAENALNKATTNETNINLLKSETLAMSYDSDSEMISVIKGV